jgi:hypothetical protein
MVKMKHKGLLLLGLIPAKLEHLKQGLPLRINLADIGLPGQGIAIIVGENHEKLKRMAEDAAERFMQMDADKPRIDVSQVKLQ